jgi:predicted transcriptional regulator
MNVWKETIKAVNEINHSVAFEKKRCIEIIRQSNRDSFDTSTVGTHLSRLVRGGYLKKITNNHYSRSYLISENTTTSSCERSVSAAPEQENEYSLGTIKDILLRMDLNAKAIHSYKSDKDHYASAIRCDINNLKEILGS